MITGTFKGANIIQMPSSPAPKSIDFSMRNVVASAVNPFTGLTQVMNWQAGWLSASITMPPMTYEQSRDWIAFFSQLRGITNAFQMGDPLGAQPRGYAGIVGATVYVTGGPYYAYSCVVKGFPANVPALLLPGDYIQSGYRLYRVTDPVVADGSGNALINFWPQIREPLIENSPIGYINTVGLWRLDSNVQSWSVDASRMTGFSFGATEFL